MATKLIGVRLPEDLKELTEAAAEVNGVRVGKIIVEALRRFFDIPAGVVKLEPEAERRMRADIGKPHKYKPHRKSRRKKLQRPEYEPENYIETASGKNGAAI